MEQFDKEANENATKAGQAPAFESPTKTNDSGETLDTDFVDPRLLAAIEHDTLTRRATVTHKFEDLSRHLEMATTIATELRTLFDEQI